jgi:putative ABC transport system ATP-binding protein
VNRPSLILADEPTGNLDTKTSAEIMELFQNLNVQQGITIIFVTHEPDIADYARRQIIFRDGRVVSDRKTTKKLDIHERLAAVPFLLSA